MLNHFPAELRFHVNARFLLYCHGNMGGNACVRALLPLFAEV